MPHHISFECSQQLTPNQMMYMRRAIEAAIDAMVKDRIDMPTLEDIPEYFYTVLQQEEITV